MKRWPEYIKFKSMVQNIKYIMFSFVVGAGGVKFIYLEIYIHSYSHSQFLDFRAGILSFWKSSEWRSYSFSCSSEGFECFSLLIDYSFNLRN